ncbi:AraC family transcriptional regulator [Aminipila butyrica]|uniref:AraC family transcriptional regulator n=1 Tax=Aminipila butyrica TaxID=433296 RepID=A0A858BYM3_9FIRM|nr:AraC family transcriptional regulator [Aminipila butyrica]QIB70000.1 AraC family transcriptional regulator [Aminipila butyrica]
MKNVLIPMMDKPKGNSLSDYLIHSLEAFATIAEIPVTYFDNRHQICREFRRDHKICNFFEVYQRCSGPCRRNLASSGQFASRLGEPYIFLCKAGLTHIATSLIVEKKSVGYFIAGPLVMGELRNSTSGKFSALNSLEQKDLSQAEAFARQMKVYHPNEISQLALLFYNSIITSASAAMDYDDLRNQYSQQNRIGSDIQQYKKDLRPMEYPYELENLLLDSITQGQMDEARNHLDQLMKTFSVLEAGDLEGIKAKTLWLFAIILRIAGENEKNLSDILDADLDVIHRLSEATSCNQLIDAAQDITQVITKNMLTSIYNGHSQIVAKALQFINRHYRDKITLRDMEETLHVNPSYFSTLFRHEMGVTFTDYLNALKIQWACQLLSTTNLSIIDVSLSSGFDDQSYFTKVFKKAKGVTPKQYRGTHSSGDTDSSWRTFLN